jgi:protein involved in polysaccharide export with SLBB domain
LTRELPGVRNGIEVADFMGSRREPVIPAIQEIARMRFKAGSIRAFSLVLNVVLVGLMLVSCSGRQDIPVKVTAIAPADSVPKMPTSMGSDFMLGPQDFLEIRFLGEPSLNLETRVRPDGTLSVPLINEPVQVFGMTPKNLEHKIEEDISKFLRNSRVFVNVKDIGSSSVFVLGEVRSPQIVTDQPLTLASVISRCGGLSRDSDAGQILVIRKWNQEEPLVFEINFDSFLDGESILSDLPLQRYDVVIVPRNRISKISEFMSVFFEGPRAIPRLGIDTAIFFDVLDGSYQSYVN